MKTNKSSFTVEEKFSKKPKKKIATQLYQLLIAVIVPLLAMLIVLMSLLYTFNQDYSQALQNATIVAEFNEEYDFKKQVDTAMWYYVIKGSAQPLDEVEKAIRILNRLQATTELEDNKWRVRSMLNMCESLKGYMNSIAETDEYDEQMRELETNINSVTTLIEQYMNQYTYDEIRELSRLQMQLSARVQTTIYITVAITVVLVISLFVVSSSFTRHITSPINQLCEKVRQFGQGKVASIFVKTNSVEIQTLDDGFDNMMLRINALRQKERTDQDILHRTELELLQSQINPHFLYNTLDSIVWLAEMDKNEDVVNMVTSLSVFFRNSLSKGKDVITLGVEREQVLSYLEIQKIRYRDILEYSVEIPEELWQYSIPKLTLQPLVENALYHGIKHRRGKGTITIKAIAIKDTILLEVKDNGIGMSENELEKLRHGLTEDRNLAGLGLRNVNQRVQLYCGVEYGLNFFSVMGEGTTVILTIPKKI